MTKRERDLRRFLIGHFVLFMLLIVAYVVFLFGCSAPRVVQCDKCGEFAGVIGGNLPGQGSRCPCGGCVKTVRKLSHKEWAQAKERGYVTLQDGEAVGPASWTPNYDQAEEPNP
jgi:hypothetical protein